MEAVDFYIKNPTKWTSFHAPTFYPFSKLLLRKLYNLDDEFNIFMTPRHFFFHEREVYQDS